MIDTRHCSRGMRNRVHETVERQSGVQRFAAERCARKRHRSTAVAAGRPATVAPWRRSAANVTGTLTADVRS